MDKLGILRRSQVGFCKGKYCLTKLKFFDGDNKNMDKGDPLDIIYLDFQNAFAKIPKNRIEWNRTEQNRIVPIGKGPASSSPAA